MGVIKQGILGGFSGKVANVVGSSWKGIAVIKSLPLSVANPRTASQVANRSKFSNAVAFATAILVGTIKPLLDRIAVKQSGYNLFVSLNQSLFAAAAPSVPADLVISQGVVTPPVDVVISESATPNAIDIAWTDNSATGDALATDVLYGCFQDGNSLEVISIPTTAVRGDEALTAVFPDSFVVGDNGNGWFAFRRADGSKASNTAYAAYAV